jgi:transposase
VAGHQKKARALSATLAFADESGFLLAPLVHTTLAPRGHTPVLRHRARHRDKVSVAAAVTLSPARGRVGLRYATFPDAYVDGEAYAAFVRAVLLRDVRGPVVLLHDRGNMHRGPFVRALCADHPRLSIDPLPPYAPELNPVEPAWNYAKDKRMANYPPADVPTLEARVCECLEEARHDQDRLRSFLVSTPLSWAGTSFNF